jgi:hypothetical protein
MPVMDSPLNNAFAHFVMLSLYFVGSRELQLDGAELMRAHAIESFDSAVVRTHTVEGVKLWFGTSHACAETVEPEIVITGSRGQAVWRYESEARWQADDGAVARRPLLAIAGARRAMFAAALARLHDPAGRICTTELAGRHTALIETIHQRAPIGSVPPAAVRWTGANGEISEVPDILGLGAALRRSYAAEQSLAAGGFRLGA